MNYSGVKVLRFIFILYSKIKQILLDRIWIFQVYYSITALALLCIISFGIYLFATDFFSTLFYYLYNFKNLDYTPLGIVSGLAVYLITIIVISNNLNKKNNIIKAERDELILLNSRYVAEIEKREKTERSLKLAEQSLEQSSKLAEIGQMSAAINHEISQPLSALKTYLSSMRILIDRKKILEARSNFSRVDDLIDRMEKITTQLKLFSRKSEDLTEKINLLDSVDASLSLITPQFIDKRIRIKYQPPKEKLVVIGDQIKIQQIIINLLNNAVDALENIEDALITIKFVCEESTTQVKISDNGIGMDEPNSVFDPFYTTKAHGKGVGLGLSISYDLAMKFGGNLKANNIKPSGSEFTLTLRNG